MMHFKSAEGQRNPEATNFPWDAGFPNLRSASMNHLLLKHHIFGWLAAFIMILFKHIAIPQHQATFFSKALCFPQPCPWPCKEADKGRTSCPTAPMNTISITQPMCSDSGGQRRERGEPGVYLLLEGDLILRSPATCVLGAEGTLSRGVK